MAGSEINDIADLFPDPAKQESVAVESEHGTLYGTLDLPQASGGEAHPAILLIAGSGPTDRDGNSTALSKPNESLKMLGGWFASMGAAVLRYDKRGVGESKEAAGEIAETEFDAMVRDALLWIELLKKDPRFSSIGIVGHSEGSLVGLLASGRARIDFFISIAGAGRPIGVIIREQLQGQPGFIRKKAFQILDELDAGRTVEKVPFYLKSLFDSEKQTYFISWNRIDPSEIMRGLDVPALVIQGSTDLQTSIKDAEILAGAGSSARLAVIEGMNHILKDAPAAKLKNFKVYTAQGVPLSNNLIDELRSFLTDVM